MARLKLFAIRSGNRSFIASVTGYIDVEVRIEYAAQVEVGVDRNYALSKHVILILTVPLELDVGPAKETK